MEVIQILISGYRFPGAAPKIGPGIAGRLAIHSLTEVEIFTILTVGIFQRLLEPFMLIGAMIDDQVHNDMHVPLLCFRQKFVKLLHRAKRRINRIIV